MRCKQWKQVNYLAEGKKSIICTECKQKEKDKSEKDFKEKFGF